MNNYSRISLTNTDLRRLLRLDPRTKLGLQLNLKLSTEDVRENISSQVNLPSTNLLIKNLTESTKLKPKNT